MNLTGVTLTGADDTVSPAEICDLSRQYPFVEWGILVGSRNGPRFPSNAWLNDLASEVSVAGFPVRLSLHLCGKPLRGLMAGTQFALPSAIEYLNFARVQLNFHGHAVSEDQFFNLYESTLHDWYADEKTIVQLDGVNDWILDRFLTASDTVFDVQGLYDQSHGAGVLPDAGWPQANPRWDVGYAGGLGPENVVRQLPLIAKAAGDKPFWIDMETRLRIADGLEFALGRCERVLRATKPWVTE